MSNRKTSKLEGKETALFYQPISFHIMNFNSGHIHQFSPDLRPDHIPQCFVVFYRRVEQSQFLVNPSIRKKRNWGGSGELINIVKMNETMIKL
jgi:hypothetical protein